MAGLSRDRGRGAFDAVNDNDLGLSIPIARVLYWLLGGAALLAVVNGVLGLLQAMGFDDEAPWFKLFDLNVEGNVPTWYSSIVLALAAAAAAAVAKAMAPSQPYRRHWIGIAAIFAYLSLDEAAQIHETVFGMLSVTGLEGAADVIWVIPALTLVLIVGVAYFRFWLAQEPKVKRLMVLAALLYVGGAVGAELGGSLAVDRVGPGILTGLIVLIEETAEIVGASLFLYTWLYRLRSLKSRLGVELV